MNYYRPRISRTEWDLIKEYRDNDNTENNNILVIGDLHEPFCLDKYLDFCVEKYTEFGCNEVVMIGDCLDNHFASYHETYGGT